MAVQIKSQLFIKNMYTQINQLYTNIMPQFHMTAITIQTD